MLNKEISISLKNIALIEKLESVAKENNASSSNFLNYWKRREKEKIEKILGIRKEFTLILKEKWRGGRKLTVSIPPTPQEGKCRGCQNQKKQILLSTKNARGRETDYCSECTWSKIREWKEGKLLVNEEILNEEWKKK